MIGDGNSGATFSEVMVAMALVSVGVMGAMGAFEAAGKSLGRDTLAARALSMAESRVEAKRATPWEQLLSDDLDHDGRPDVVMHDDGIAGDRLAGDGVYSAMLEQDGVMVVWTIASPYFGSPVDSGAVLIEARSMYRANGREREVRFATLRANPAFTANH
jgi:hypothetical protein